MEQMRLDLDTLETRAVRIREKIDKADYNAFVQKFEPKKTTDDCYTPETVYDAVANHKYGVATVGQSATSPVLSPEDYAACKAHIEAKKAEAEPKPVEKPMADEKGKLKVTNMVLDFSGAAGCYRADQEKREVTLGITTYTYDKLADLIADLTALKEAVHA